MKTILLVDDNRMLTDLYAKGLTRQDFEVITANSGQECLEILKNTHPDIILLDIMMPGMDGWETVEHIRRLPERREIPVLMVTAKALLAEDLLAHGDRIDGFLLKPFTLHDLADRIQDFERERLELAACLQEIRGDSDDPKKFSECAELARQIIVQKNLTEQLVLMYGTGFIGSDAGGEIPDVLRQLQVLHQGKADRLANLAGQALYDRIVAIPKRLVT